MSSLSMVRRSVLLAGAGLVAAALAGFGFPLARRDGLRAGIARVVKRGFGDDIAPESVLNEFADFYIRLRQDESLTDRRKALIRYYGSYAPLFDLALRLDVGPIVRRMADIEADVLTEFLRNTTMTYRQAGEEIAFAERPQRTAFVCVNRLARFDYND